MRIYLRDFKHAGHCANGIRGWFAQQGFDWRDFVKNGIEAQRMIDTGDVLAIEIVRRKQAEENHG